MSGPQTPPLPAHLCPVPIRLNCPGCGELHIDEGEFATKPHHTHACQGCGLVWRPAIVPTVGVRFLPGFLNPSTERLGEALFALSARLKAAGFFDDPANHSAYEAVVSAWGAVAK